MPFTKEELGEWWDVVSAFQGEAWFQSLQAQVDAAYAESETPVYPPRDDLFSALRMTPPRAVKCVILGQDPYHEEGQAHGMSFSVREGVKIPRSLQNIYKELHNDLDLPVPTHGYLGHWAEQGVLLLNSVLTVYQGQANSHKRWGWEEFTTGLLRALAGIPHPIAFVLWGRSAQAKGESAHLEESAYPRLVLRANHPSPLSANRGFFGSRPFSQVNAFLQDNGCAPIDWNIP